MRFSFSRINPLVRHLNKEDKQLFRSMRMILGFKPRNIRPYRTAVQHTSVAKSVNEGFKESNERLEYLGDAVLGMVVAEYLFKKYPFKDEGFLTELRSRIVSRDALNNVARKMGIPDIVKFDRRRKTPNSHKSLYGNTLEALVGAIYVDRGYQSAKRFIIKKLLNPHYDIQEIISTTKNYKSKLIEWCQKQNKSAIFKHAETIDKGYYNEFIIELCLDDEPIARGHGLSKKKAEQDASREACTRLSIE